MRSIALIVLAVLGACSEAEQPPAPRSENAVFVELVSDLCSAITLAEQGDVDGAERIFENEIHGLLHDLAAEIEESDREATADLLVAKNSVEAAFSSGERNSLETELTGLAESLSVALTALGIDNSGCP